MIPSPTGQPPAASWWVESWSSQISAALAIALAFFGLITAISPFSPLCIVAGILQLIAAAIILAVEAPTFVAFLRFAQGVGRFFEGKPNYMKAAVYGVLTIIPLFTGCSGVAFFLGFIASLAIAALFGLLTLGRKASRAEMQFQAGGTPTTGQPYSPTSP